MGHNCWPFTPGLLSPTSPPPPLEFAPRLRRGILAKRFKRFFAGVIPEDGSSLTVHFQSGSDAGSEYARLARLAVESDAP